MRRFALTSSRGGETPWQFERDVTVREIQGWLRRVDGVARVASVTLKRDGAVVSNGTATIRRAELPQLQVDAAAISVLRPGEARL
jgi:hypothetical protein